MAFVQLHTFATNCSKLTPSESLQLLNTVFSYLDEVSALLPTKFGVRLSRRRDELNVLRPVRKLIAARLYNPPAPF